MQGAPVYSIADEQRARAESAAWSRFASPADSAEFCASWLALHLRMQEGQVAEARFTAFGCPVGIAVGHWLAAQAVGKTIAELRVLSAAELRCALEIPDDKLHCALMGEDALKSIAAQ